MRFVANDQIPFGSSAQFGLQLLGARRHIEPKNEPVTLDKRIAGDRGFDLITGDGVKAEPEFLGHLILPLFDEVARRDDQAALEVATDQKLLDQQPSHDGFAGARIIGEQEAQGLSRQHLAIHRRDLVRQRLDLRRGDGEIRVKEVGEPYSIGLGRKPQQPAIGVKEVTPAGLYELEANLFATIE